MPRDIGTSAPLFDAIYSSIREIEQAEDQALRLLQLRARFGIEEGEPLAWPVFSPVLGRSDGLAVRRVWVGEEDRTGYLLIERED